MTLKVCCWYLQFTKECIRRRGKSCPGFCYLAPLFLGKKHLQMKFCSRNLTYKVPLKCRRLSQLRIPSLCLYNWIYENMWYCKGMSEWAAYEWYILELFCSLLFLLCFSKCMNLTGFSLRGDQAQLHPQCGVRLPFRQRCTDAALRCAM